jgi:hypothetical protein
MHPDEATEAIVDGALNSRVPFAVVPCCVLPQYFPWRRQASGVPVKKYGAFVEYLLAKDARIRRTQLPFEGRNTVLYMCRCDYATPDPALAWLPAGPDNPGKPISARKREKYLKWKATAYPQRRAQASTAGPETAAGMFTDAVPDSLRIGEKTRPTSDVSGCGDGASPGLCIPGSGSPEEGENKTPVGSTWTSSSRLQ